MGKEKSNSGHPVGDEEYIEPHILQGDQPPEAQSKKKCEECAYYYRDLTINPCWDCYATTNKPEWVKGKPKDETGDVEFRKVGSEDSGPSTPYLS